MPEDLSRLEPLSPPWWRHRLSRKLAKRRPPINQYEAYYGGQHRLAFATSKFRRVFGQLFNGFADNWCDLIVDASVERLAIEGFRFGNDQHADDRAWGIWQDNQMDAASTIANTEAVKNGESYLLIAPPRDGEESPAITVEHPLEMIVETVPGVPRLRRAALKEWVDDEIDGHGRAIVYLPDGLYWFRSERKIEPGAGSGEIRWEQRPDNLGGYEVANTVGVVPVIPLLNNPSLLHGGRSDLLNAIPVQDAVDKLVVDMLVASEFAAFRQRWATGIEIPGAEDGDLPQDSERFLSSVERVWTVADEKAKFGEFSATDLGNYVKAIEMLIQHLAAQTRTPPHYLLGQSGAFPSGESLKSTETGLVAKVRRKQIWFGEAYEEAMRLAFKLLGDDKRATANRAETIWRDPESRTEGERVDALVKMHTLGVPLEALWEKWGASQEEIKRWKVMQQEEAFRQGLDVFLGNPKGQGNDLNPPPTPVVPAGAVNGAGNAG